MMERLSFSAQQQYNAVEAASHLNRYLAVRRLCAGRRVLDVACGEGYGAFLMAEHWGAAAVEAVDVSPEAIERARTLFAHERVRFHCKAAEALEELFPDDRFDLIVSLETIEHVPDAAAFLEALRQHLRPGGTVVITCPNDYWYYPTPEERNPFHVRKFTLHEFLAIAEGVFGPAREVLLGTPLAGFANVPMQARELTIGGGREDTSAMLSARPSPEALLLPSDECVTWKNCSYFLGIWAPDQQPEHEGTAALFPCSMSSSTHASQEASIQNLREEVIHLRTVRHEAERLLQWRERREAEIECAHENALQELREKLAAAEAQRIELERVKRHVELRLAALRAENSYMHEEAFRARRHYDWIEERRGRAEARVSELETFIEGLRRTIADQTVLVDERDAYIRELEQRVADLAARPGNRILRFAKRVARRLLGRGG